MRSLLSHPALFELFSRLVGAEHIRSVYVRDFVRPKEGDRVLDIGCGPADILPHLPRVDYFGFDISPRYIDSARKRFGERGRFFCENVSAESLSRDQAESFDIALASGVLHHLTDDEATSLFQTARRALRPGGRLVTFDGCYEPGQSPFARYLLSKDRGRHVRDRAGYVSLAQRVFGDVRATVRHDLLRIPYTHIILECPK
jgi:SAM-dependent methyltransferase